MTQVSINGDNIAKKIIRRVPQYEVWYGNPSEAEADMVRLFDAYVMSVNINLGLKKDNAEFQYRSYTYNDLQNRIKLTPAENYKVKILYRIPDPNGEDPSDTIEIVYFRGTIKSITQSISDGQEIISYRCNGAKELLADIPIIGSHYITATDASSVIYSPTARPIFGEEIVEGNYKNYDSSSYAFIYEDGLVTSTTPSSYDAIKYLENHYITSPFTGMEEDVSKIISNGFELPQKFIDEGSSVYLKNLDMGGLSFAQAVDRAVTEAGAFSWFVDYNNDLIRIMDVSRFEINTLQGETENLSGDTVNYNKDSYRLKNRTGVAIKLGELDTTVADSIPEILSASTGFNIPRIKRLNVMGNSRVVETTMWTNGWGAPLKPAWSSAEATAWKSDKTNPAYDKVYRTFTLQDDPLDTSAPHIDLLPASQPANITGVTILAINNRNGENGIASAGDFEYDSTGNGLRYKAPGSSSFGAYMVLSADGKYTLSDGDDGLKQVQVDVVTGSLPVGDESDSISYTGTVAGVAFLQKAFGWLVYGGSNGVKIKYGERKILPNLVTTDNFVNDTAGDGSPLPIRFWIKKQATSSAVYYEPLNKQCSARVSEDKFEIVFETDPQNRRPIYDANADDYNDIAVTLAMETDYPLMAVAWIENYDDIIKQIAEDIVITVDCDGRNYYRYRTNGSFDEIFKTGFLKAQDLELVVNNSALIAGANENQFTETILADEDFDYKTRWGAVITKPENTNLIIYNRDTQLSPTTLPQNGEWGARPLIDDTLAIKAYTAQKMIDRLTIYQTGTIEIDGVDTAYFPGQYLEKIERGATSIEINSIITSVTYDMQSDIVTITFGKP